MGGAAVKIPDGFRPYKPIKRYPPLFEIPRLSSPPFCGCVIALFLLLKALTQEQLAVRVGVRRETVVRLEKAQYNPALKLAIDIARAVEAPIEEIFIFD